MNGLVWEGQTGRIIPRVSFHPPLLIHPHTHLPPTPPPPSTQTTLPAAYDFELERKVSGVLVGYYCVGLLSVGREETLTLFFFSYAGGHRLRSLASRGREAGHPRITRCCRRHVRRLERPPWFRLLYFLVIANSPLFRSLSSHTAPPSPMAPRRPPSRYAGPWLGFEVEIRAHLLPACTLTYPRTCRRVSLA